MSGCCQYASKRSSAFAGPSGADSKEPQRTSVRVTRGDGSTVTPIALADDDPDNFVHVCLDTTIEARSVAVKAVYVHDPGNDANPDTQVYVVDGEP